MAVKQVNGFSGVFITKDGMKLFTIGAVSRKIIRSTDWIRMLHDTGLLPPVIAVDARGWRLYTENQFYWMAHVLSGVTGKPRKDTLKTLLAMVVENWEADYEKYEHYRRTGRFSPSEQDLS